MRSHSSSITASKSCFCSPLNSRSVSSAVTDVLIPVSGVRKSCAMASSMTDLNCSPCRAAFVNLQLMLSNAEYFLLGGEKQRRGVSRKRLHNVPRNCRSYVQQAALAQQSLAQFVE